MDMLASGRGLDVLHNGAGKLGVTLSSEADAERSGSDWTEPVPVHPGAGAFQQAAMDQSSEQTEDSGLRELGAFNDIGETKLFAKAVEGLEDIAGTKNGLGLIAVATAVGYAACGRFQFICRGFNRSLFRWSHWVHTSDSGAILYSEFRN